jgi:hypothetical protein
MNRKHVLSSIFAAALVLLLAALIFLPADPTLDSPRGWPTATVDERKANGLAIRAWLDAGRLDLEGNAQLHLLVHNHSGGDIGGLQIADLQTAGFVHPKEWRIGSRKGDSATLLGTLKAGESRTIETRMQPAELGKFSIGALISWSCKGGTCGESAQESSAFVTLGPIVISTPLRDGLARFVRRVNVVAKDFALPLVLVVLVYVFQVFQNKRQEADNTARADREFRLQVWTSELPRLRDNANQYYLPFVSSMRALVSVKPKATHTNDELNQQYYSFVLFVRQWKDMRTNHCTIFFKERDPEEIARLVLTILKRHIDGQFTTHVAGATRVEYQESGRTGCLS